MNNLFNYTTIEQQIEKLKNQLLTFKDESAARIILQTYGYYNIINGYRDPYIIREYDKKKYSSNVTFEQIFALFSLDHEIRDAVLLAMIDLEEHLRAAVAEIIAEDFGSNYLQYLQKNNYRDRQVSNPNFRRNKILDGMMNTAVKSNIQPIKYYREQHDVIPPWILLKGINFGTLVNFIRFFKSPQRDKLILTLYGNKIEKSSLESYKDILSDTLFTCLEYRNLAAHGGRIYNYIPSCSIRYFKESNLKKGLPQFLSILQLFQYQQPYGRINDALLRALNAYCPNYPDDLERLEKAIGFKIIEEQQVWVNIRTKKLHSDQHCSGSNKCIKMLYQQAITDGFLPCKRCCR